MKIPRFLIFLFERAELPSGDSREALNQIRSRLFNLSELTDQLQSNLVISDRDISEFCLFRPSLAEPEKICSIYRNLSILAISDCFTDFLVYSDIKRGVIFIRNSFIFGRNMPLPTEEQRNTAVVV